MLNIGRKQQPPWAPALDGSTIRIKMDGVTSSAIYCLYVLFYSNYASQQQDPLLFQEKPNSMLTFASKYTSSLLLQNLSSFIYEHCNEMRW